ncbi:MAG: SMP-30/gluconolactonase/LRE family protein [Aliiglaciecola sp.]
MLNCNLETVLNVQNRLGEGVIWDSSQQCFWWTDILTNKMFRWAFNGKPQVFDTPHRLCSFGLTPVANKFIAAFDFGFAFFEPLTGKIENVCEVESSLHNNRLNDGRVDRQGRFWVGSMRQSESGELGSLYCLANGQAIKRLDGIEISNGLCWSQNGRQIYHADSPTRTIKVADYNAENGQISHWRKFVKTDKGAYPDGACIDNEDHLWSAQWGSHKIKRYTPLGEEVFEFELPCKQPTCIAFGGPDLQHIIVTSAWDGLENEPGNTSDQGSVFVLKTNVKGIVESICTQN